MKELLILSFCLLVFCQINFPPFGKETKEKLFQLAPNGKKLKFLTFLEIYINHGSYGATLKSVTESQFQIHKKMQLNPLRFLNREMHVLLNKTIEKVAEYINADKDDVALIENASYGVNSVLRSQNFQKGDKILVTSLGYNAVRTTLEMLKDKYQIEVINVQIPLPTTSHDIINRIKKALDENSIKFVVIDHISSFPSVELPIKPLIQLTRER